jgi:hypothetical protein
VSGEDEGTIQQTFIDQLGAKYPIVRVAKKDVAAYGITFYPSVYVIDPDGNVSSVPDDRMPSEDKIEELLKRATLLPKLPDDARYEPLRALWKKAEFARLREYLDKNLAAPNFDAAMKEVFEAQKAMLDKKQAAALARVQSLGAGPDYADSEVQLERIGKQWKGLEPAAAAAKELARFEGDAAIKKELTAGRALQKLMAAHDQSKFSGRKKLAEALAGFRKKYDGTLAARQAFEAMERLNGQR